MNDDVDNTVQVWDALTGEHALIYRKHYYYVQAAAWSPDAVFSLAGLYFLARMRT